MLINEKYFPPQIRRDVDTLYVDFKLPYSRQIRDYDQFMTVQWSVDRIVGYMKSWSGWQQLCKKNGDKTYMDKLEHRWKSSFGDEVVAFSWPMGIHFSQKPF